MSERAGDKSPKTLADVSHLFFSNDEERRTTAPVSSADAPAEDGGSPVVEERPPQGGDGAVPVEPTAPGGAASGAAAGERTRTDGRWHRTGVFVVTGGARSPGKSTVAVNLAHALMSRGRVGLVDADPKLPNARFYMGLPSWHYLSPVTWEGRPAPNTLSDSGLVVVDRASGTSASDELVGVGDVTYVDISGGGRVPLHYLVVDLPAPRAAWLRPVTERVGLFVVVMGPDRASFEETYVVLSELRGSLGLEHVGLVVNKVRDQEDARDIHAKTAAAAERLLSMRVSLLGGVAVEENLGSRQRERGAIVRSRPDAVAALQLREVATQALGIVAGS
jgi:flagellar biosynthesis protein FlhG